MFFSIQREVYGGESVFKMLCFCVILDFFSHQYFTFSIPIHGHKFIYLRFGL